VISRFEKAASEEGENEVPAVMAAMQNPSSRPRDVAAGSAERQLQKGMWHLSWQIV